VTAKIIDGNSIASAMRVEIANRCRLLREQHGVVPGLAAVLVGDDPASQIYVRNKRRACEQAGLNSWLHKRNADTSQSALLDLIAELNSHPDVHGILVQLPLPSHIREESIVEAVDPSKDVDGFGPVSLGLLAAGRPRFMPCTPHGVQQMLLRSDIPIEGRHVVIVGRSNIVGKPLSLILMQKAAGANATVTVCHSRTPDIGAITRSGDIVVVAIGHARFLKADMVRPGASVIDVGINRIDGAVVGDVDFETVREVAGAVSPVPGGVGPMTITMLLHNTVLAAHQSLNMHRPTSGGNQTATI
jgi:methylenetetrahydrofolate dehydrogenase (NADP+)/methenyltetrahydrofolate cyclohydrolase